MYICTLLLLLLLKMLLIVLSKVADLDALLNRTRRRRTHERHHQRELMSRASRSNQDRAAVLLHNNPLPQLNYSSADDTTSLQHTHAVVSSAGLCHSPYQWRNYERRSEAIASGHQAAGGARGRFWSTDCFLYTTAVSYTHLTLPTILRV